MIEAEAETTTKTKQTWVDLPFLRFWLLEQTAEAARLPWYIWLWKNRFVRLFFVLLSIFVCIGVIYGWAAFSSILFAEDVFIWKCSLEDREAHKLRVIADASERLKPACGSQDDAVQALYYVHLAAELFCGTVAGIWLDFLGPFLTGLMGQVTLVLGFVALIIASVAQPWLYFAASVLLGMACNFIVYPALAVADYFPGREGFIASLALAAQNGATLVPALLKILSATIRFRLLFQLFLAFFVVPLGIFYVLCMPLVRFALKNSHHRPPAVEMMVDTPLEGQSEGAIARLDERSQERTVWKDAFSLEFVLMAVFSILAIIQFNYYIAKLREVTSVAVSNFQEYIYPTQAVWGAVYGYAVDYTGTLPICYLLVILIGLVYAFWLLPSTALHYLTVVLHTLAATYIYTVKFTFVQETFSPRRQGVLLGILSFLSGITALSTIPLNQTKPLPVTVSMLVSVFVSGMIIVLLHIRARKGINYVDNEEQNAATKEGFFDIKPESGTAAV